MVVLYQIHLAVFYGGFSCSMVELYITEIEMPSCRLRYVMIMVSDCILVSQFNPLVPRYWYNSSEMEHSCLTTGVKELHDEYLK